MVTHDEKLAKQTGRILRFFDGRQVFSQINDSLKPDNRSWLNYLKMVLAGMGRNKFFTALSLFGISSTVMIVMTVVLIFENSTTARKPESRLSRDAFH